jgi:hypothetical protein
MEERFFATTFVAVFTSLIILAMQYSEQSAAHSSNFSVEASNATLAHIVVKAMRTEWSGKN